MALGEEGDFRSSMWQQVPRFPGQDRIGGAGTPMLQQWTQPYGSSNMSQPVPPFTSPALNFPGITFPGITFPNQLPPVVLSGSGTGTAPANTVAVFGGASTPAPVPVNQIEFNGTALVDVVVSGGNAVVTYDSSGGGGSTLKYGKITASSQPSSSVAYWNYTIAEYSAGSPNGTTYSANNLLEWGNTSTSAYGYTVTSGNRLSTTPASSFYISPVPNGTMVRLENTSAMGSSGYWFSAPNPITGGC